MSLCDNVFIGIIHIIIVFTSVVYSSNRSLFSRAADTTTDLVGYWLWTLEDVLMSRERLYLEVGFCVCDDTLVSELCRRI